MARLLRVPLLISLHDHHANGFAIQAGDIDDILRLVTPEEMSTEGLHSNVEWLELTGVGRVVH